MTIKYKKRNYQGKFDSIYMYDDSCSLLDYLCVYILYIYRERKPVSNMSYCSCNHTNLIWKRNFLSKPKDDIRYYTVILRSTQ